MQKGPGFAPRPSKFNAQTHRSLFGGFDGLGLGDGPVGRAYLEAGKAADGDVLAELADLLRDQLFDAMA